MSGAGVDDGLAQVAVPEAVRSDSAGVEVVETRFEVIPQLVLGEPTLSIGTVAGGPDQELYGVRTPWVREDGRLVFANSGTREVRFYNQDGSLLKSVGRDGQGPGEYQLIAWVQPWRGDSLAVWDGFAGRMTLLDRDGEFGRTLRLASSGARASSAGGGVGGGRPGALVSAVAVFPGDRFLGRVGGASAVPGDTSAVLRDLISYRVFDAEGREVSPVAEVLDSENFRFASGDSRSVGPLPFGKSSAVMPLDQASGEAVLAVADNSGFAVQWLADDGRLLRISRVPLAALPVTDAMKEGYRLDQEEVMRDLPAFVQESRRTMMRAAPYPDSLPIHGDMVVAESRVWLERSAAPGADSPREWIAFDSETGVATARLTLPAGVTLASVRGSTAVLVAVDELGVERVVLAPIRPGPG